MALSPLLRQPRLVEAGIRIDRAPSALYLGLFAAALLPTAWWMARRMVDGSDDPLGAIALATLLGLAWHHRRRLRASPRPGWLAAALLAMTLSTATLGLLPPLASALLGLVALGCALIAFLPPGVAAGPVLGLSVLSLPLLASLQFYAGYPLRVLTAEASRWLLAGAWTVERSGASLRVDGQLVIVDAPCSGVQMVWLGYFTACVVALHARRSDREFLRRLPAVGLLVLAGNVVRNSLLVALEAGPRPVPGWLHEGIGLLVLALVCTAIARVLHGPLEPRHA